MANTAAVDVWACAADIVAALSEFADGPLTVNRVGSTEVPTELGTWVVGDVPEDDNAIVIADSVDASNALARRAFDLLVARTAWRLELRDRDTAEVVAARPAVAAA